MARRFPDVAVVAMDFSDTVAELAERAHAPANLHAVQGDVTRPPFKPGAFANVTSIGVLHHTADTYRAFGGIAPLVRPGGCLGIWIYPHFQESPPFNRLYYIIRDVLFLGQGHNLPPAVRLGLLRVLCVPFVLLVPIFFLSRAFNPAFYQDLRPMDLYRGLVFSLYDNLAPCFQFRHKKAEVQSWYAEHGFGELQNPEFGFYAGRKAQLG
jgi:SAM-dependent methyltransferase